MVCTHFRRGLFSSERYVDFIYNLLNNVGLCKLVVVVFVEVKRKRLKTEKWKI